MEESCQAAKEAAEAIPDTTDCPCLSGGQWTFDGEKQSYCQQPNGLGKKPWCPTSESEVTSGDMDTLSFAYCNNKKLKACQLLEGTKLPTQCPCVEGGQFKYQGQSYSYCEEVGLPTSQADHILSHFITHRPTGVPQRWTRVATLLVSLPSAIRRR